ncbi:unnamed protein product [Prunus armeniaca]
MPNFVKKFRSRLVRKWHCLVGGKFSIKSWENGDALVKAMDNYRSGENRTNEMIQAQMW